MTVALYSVDRGGFYRTGNLLSLAQEDPFNRPLLNLPGWFGDNDLRSHLQALFPDGLSPHGWQYLVNRHDFIRVDGSQTAFVNHEMAVELVFEYVRRAAFQRAQSRFQSFFAWESLEQALGFRQGDQPIYRLESDHVMYADQCWLTLGVQNVAASFSAHNYWRGVPTNQPRWEAVLAPPVCVMKRIA